MIYHITNNHIISNCNFIISNNLTTAAHPTLPHNKPYYYNPPSKQLHNTKINYITTIDTNCYSQQKYYLCILSLPYNYFFQNFCPRVTRKLIEIIM